MVCFFIDFVFLGGDYLFGDLILIIMEEVIFGVNESEMVVVFGYLNSIGVFLEVGGVFFMIYGGEI